MFVLLIKFVVIVRSISILDEMISGTVPLKLSFEGDSKYDHAVPRYKYIENFSLLRNPVTLTMPPILAIVSPAFLILHDHFER